MPSINMRSTAEKVKGQGVGSAYAEQVGLMKRGLKGFKVYENALKVCDIHHYHTINPDYFIERMLLKDKSIAVGYVHFLPDTVDESLNMPKWMRSIFYWYMLKFYNSMDYLVTVNPTFIKKIAEYDIKKPKVLCIPNFVAKADFYEQKLSKKANTRKKYKVPQNKFVVLGVGQLQRRKGVAEFVEVAKMQPDVQFIWAGGFSFGRMSDGYDEIQKIMENPPKNVKFLGIIPREEMNDLYNMADLMFLPSYGELFPMTILESISCKTPILLRDNEEYVNILKNYYLKATTNKGFAKIIGKLASDGEFHSKWSEKAYVCSKIYNEDNILKQWELFYSKIYLKKKFKEKKCKSIK